MPEKVNVLFLHHVSCMAGAENYLVSIWKILDKRYKGYFVCQEPGPLSDAAHELGIETSFLRMRAWRKFKNIFFNIVSVYMLIDYCHKNNIRLICSNCYRVTPYAYYVAKRLNIPVLTIIQDFIPPRKLKRFNTLKSDSLITVSRNISESVIPYYKGDVTHVYNGIDAGTFINYAGEKKSFRNEFRISAETRIIGMIAHIIPLKRHTLFLDAMKTISQQNENVVFVIVGDSPDEKQLSLEDIKGYADEIGLRDKVIFTGNRNDIASILSAFDILVHPSDREAFGRVIMEAMALGISVVATDCGGPSEIIENEKNGILVPKGDRQKIAIAVGNLLKDEKKRSDLGNKAKEHIHKNFSPDKTVNKINHILNQTLENWQGAHQ